MHSRSGGWLGISSDLALRSDSHLPSPHPGDTIWKAADEYGASAARRALWLNAGGLNARRDTIGRNNLRSLLAHLSKLGPPPDKGSSQTADARRLNRPRRRLRLPGA